MVKNSKTAFSFLVHVSKVNGEYYAGVDVNLLDMADFGIDTKDFNQLGDVDTRIYRQMVKKDKR